MANSKDYILSLFPDNVNNEITAADLRIFVNSVFDEKIDKTDIQDNLTSTDRGQPLSANQGRVLDEKISNIELITNNKEDSLGVGSFHQVLATGDNGTKVWIDLPDIEQVYVYDNLDSVSSSLALSANQGRVLNDKIHNNASSIVLINADIADINSKIDSNISDISDNSADINVLMTDVDDIRNVKIPALQNKDTQLETLITTNSNDISSIGTSITGLSQRVTNSEVDVTNLQNKDVQLAGDISDLGQRVTTNETNISNIQTQIGNVNSIVLESRVTVVEGNYASLDSRITANTDNISNLNSNITNIQSQVNTNSTNIFNNTNNIATNTTDISNLTSRVNTIDGTVSSLTPRITTNETNISNLENQIIRLDGVDSDLRSDINTNRTLIDRNIVDITNNKQDIEVIQAEQVEQDTKIQQNFVLTQNNLANVTYLLDQNTTLHQNIASLEMDVNGSPDGTIPGKENNLGAPELDNMVLGSLKDGTRVWVKNALTPDVIKEVIDNIDDPIDDSDKQYKRENSLSAYQGVVLKDKINTKEDYLGVPTVDGMMLVSDASGVRRWVEANEFRLDYGYYFGAGATLLTINIIDPTGGTIDNRLENAVRQLKCLATYQVIDKDGNIVQDTVDVTEEVNWESSNTSAYTITDGVGGGLIRCTTQDSNGSSYTDIPVNASLVDNSGNTFNSSINISIDNTPVVKVINVTPNEFTITGINNIYQLSANAVYTNGNWNNTDTNITNTAVWTSNNENVATVSNTGVVRSVSVGNAIITSSINRFDGNTISGSSLANITA